MPAANGRPRKEVDERQLAVLCRLKPTQKDCAAYFGVSPDVIERRVKEWGYEGFADFREQNMSYTRFALVQKAIDKATKGDNTMLIFCLKNLCGWADKHDKIEDSDAAVKILYELKKIE